MYESWRRATFPSHRDAVRAGDAQLIRWWAVFALWLMLAAGSPAAAQERTYRANGVEMGFEFSPLDRAGVVASYEHLFRPRHAGRLNIILGSFPTLARVNFDVLGEPYTKGVEAMSLVGLLGVYRHYFRAAGLRGGFVGGGPGVISVTLRSGNVSGSGILIGARGELGFRRIFGYGITLVPTLGMDFFPGTVQVAGVGRLTSASIPFFALSLGYAI